MIRTITPNTLRVLRGNLTRGCQKQQQQQGRKKLSSSTSKTTSEEATSSAKPSYSDPNFDPHQVSDSMIRNARTEIRIPGTEAINEVSSEIHMKNYAMAASLVGFCTAVWYYSIQAVGKPEGGMEELFADAQSAKEDQLSKSQSEKSVEELAQLDVTMSGVDGDDVIVAVAADDEIAQQEEDLNLRAAKKQNGGRPLWKKVVFFWKRD